MSPADSGAIPAPAGGQAQGLIDDPVERIRRRKAAQKKKLVLLFGFLFVCGIAAGVLYYLENERRKADAEKRKAENKKLEEEERAAVEKVAAKKAEALEKRMAESKAAGGAPAAPSVPSLTAGGGPKALSKPVATGDLTIPSIPSIPGLGVPDAGKGKKPKGKAPSAVPSVPSVPSVPGVPDVPSAEPGAKPVAKSAGSAGKAAAPVAEASGDTTSNDEWEFKCVAIEKMSRIFLKKGGILKAEGGFEFLFVQLEMKCLKFKDMAIKGVTKKANILDIDKILVVDDTQGLYKCEGFGASPETAVMRTPKLVFTEKEPERKDFLCFQVNPIATGLKLQIPNLPVLPLPVKKGK